MNLNRILLKSMPANRMFFLKMLFILFPAYSFSQPDSLLSFTFDFNEGQIKEKNNRIVIKPVGVSLTYDRFGNERSAIYIHGNASSYLNLGTSQLLKPKVGTISIWVNLEKRIYLGKGTDFNPIIYTKNSERKDFYGGYVIGYEGDIKRYGAGITKDSSEEVGIRGSDRVNLTEWYHLAITFDNKNFAFYINGKLQQKHKKGFENKYSETDSVVVGILISEQNERYSVGVFDDIQIFHRVLNETEIKGLYEAENPNTLKNILREVLKYGLVMLGLVVVIIVLVVRNRRKLKDQKERLELVNKMSQMELKAIKAQMNPHFISNCLVAIQDLIYSNNIENAGLYIAKFSYFLRQILNYSDENYITLAQELEMMRLYVELEQLRFENAFEFVLKVDEGIDQQEVLIPSIITQPFIENAIWHGLLPLKKTRTPRLTVQIIKNKNSIAIEIEDNGVGRTLIKRVDAKSKGTQLVIDKINGLNRLAGTNQFTVEIVDLLDSDNHKRGTKVIIHLNT